MCTKENLYRTPHLYDVLYLQFKGVFITLINTRDLHLLCQTPQKVHFSPMIVIKIRIILYDENTYFKNYN